MIFKNSKMYDVLKYLALIVFNAVGVAYEQLANVWDLPYGTQIMRTCAILSVLVGTLIGISSHKYNELDEETDYINDDELLEERDDE